ncbi:MAG: hemerythrin family protein [Deltaproteobacteria bacterium]|nr:hemerythrin family protein [Deltaproteobacteria bacterium]
MNPADQHHTLITGNREMDEEHAQMLSLLRELTQNLEAGDREAGREIFGCLDEFTRAHFLAEEHQMRLLAYPDFEAHRAEHEGFLETMTALRARLSDGEATKLRDDADAFARHLVAHIAMADGPLGTFHRSRTPAAS